MLYKYYNQNDAVLKLYDIIYYDHIIKINTGVKQCSILSTNLFNFFLYDLLVECKKIHFDTQLDEFNITILA